MHLLLDLPGNPATVSLFQELKPEALRPNLSEGLPFSKRIYCCSFLLIGILIKNFRFFYLSMLRLMRGQIYMWYLLSWAGIYHAEFIWYPNDTWKRDEILIGGDRGKISQIQIFSPQALILLSQVVLELAFYAALLIPDLCPYLSLTNQSHRYTLAPM